MTRPQLLLGDAIEVMRTLPDESVQTCVTSPPYWGLRDYGVEGQLGLEGSPDEYTAALVAVFREVRRVLRLDGTVWLVLGDCFSNGGRHEEKTKYNACDSSKPDRPVAAGLAPKNMVGVPWRVALALQADGWVLRSDIIWAKPNPMPESVTDRPTRSHEYIFLLAKSQRYYYDGEPLREAWADARRGRDGARLASVRNRGGRTDGFTKPNNIDPSANGGRNGRSVWSFGTQAYPEAHFATFPEALPERCIEAGSRPGDTVLDPFVGSGTTCAVASRLGRESIGIELNPEFLQLAEKRCWSGSRSLYEFVEVPA